MHVKINTANLTDEVVTINDNATKLIRMNFNPSTMKRVDRLKALAAAFLSECDEVLAEFKANENMPITDSAARSLATAKTNMQTASMWAVLGATTNA